MSAFEQFFVSFSNQDSMMTIVYFYYKFCQYCSQLVQYKSMNNNNLKPTFHQLIQYLEAQYEIISEQISEELNIDTTLKQLKQMFEQKLEQIKLIKQQQIKASDVIVQLNLRIDEYQIAANEQFVKQERYQKQTEQLINQSNKQCQRIQQLKERNLDLQKDSQKLQQKLQELKQQINSKNQKINAFQNEIISLKINMAKLLSVEKDYLELQEEHKELYQRWQEQNQLIIKYEQQIEQYKAQMENIQENQQETNFFLSRCLSMKGQENFSQSNWCDLEAKAQMENALDDYRYLHEAQNNNNFQNSQIEILGFERVTSGTSSQLKQTNYKAAYSQRLVEQAQKNSGKLSRIETKEKSQKNTTYKKYPPFSYRKRPISTEKLNSAIKLTNKSQKSQNKSVEKIKEQNKQKNQQKRHIDLQSRKSSEFIQYKLEIQTLHKEIIRMSWVITQKSGLIQQLQNEIKDLKQFNQRKMLIKQHEKIELNSKIIELKEQIRKLQVDKKYINLYLPKIIQKYKQDYQDIKHIEMGFKNILQTIYNSFIDEKRQKVIGSQCVRLSIPQKLLQQIILIIKPDFQLDSFFVSQQNKIQPQFSLKIQIQTGRVEQDPSLNQDQNIVSVIQNKQIQTQQLEKSSKQSQTIEFEETQQDQNKKDFQFRFKKRIMIEILDYIQSDQAKMNQQNIGKQQYQTPKMKSISSAQNEKLQSTIQVTPYVQLQQITRTQSIDQTYFTSQFYDLLFQKLKQSICTQTEIEYVCLPFYFHIDPIQINKQNCFTRRRSKHIQVSDKHQTEAKQSLYGRKNNYSKNNETPPLQVQNKQKYQPQCRSFYTQFQPIQKESLQTQTHEITNQQTNTQQVQMATKQVSTYAKITKMSQTLQVQYGQSPVQTQKCVKIHDATNTQVVTTDRWVQTIQQVLITNKNIQTENYLMEVEPNRNSKIWLNSLFWLLSVPKKSVKKQSFQLTPVKNNLNLPTFPKVIQFQKFDENQSPIQQYNSSKQKRQSPKLMIHSPMVHRNFIQQLPLAKLKMLNYSPFSEAYQSSEKSLEIRQIDKDRQKIVPLQLSQYAELDPSTIMNKIFSKIEPNGLQLQKVIARANQTIINWKKQKFYFINAQNDRQTEEKLILWKRGLICLLTGKMLKLRSKGTFEQNRGMLILGNSQVVACGNHIKVRNKRKNELKGNINNNNWKVLRCQIYIPKGNYL